MTDPVSLLNKAKKSRFYLWILNQVLSRMIPFNLPHKFEILEISDLHIKTMLPYRRKNKNHIGGLHACALATLSEYSTGVLLLSGLNPKEYRIILKNLDIAFFYQGKMDAFATWRINPEYIQESVLEPLKSAESVVLPCEIKIHDKQGNHLSTARVFWQIKPWAKVKTGKAQLEKAA
ncbi:hypothetical protein D770_08065 [Flammeovirgaceae bacterium 311]|nr:hypothetical protein D770_08065 [Flammeovirgaceae bacterium 311]